MAKVVGIGGVFFQAKNPQKLADWYRTTLLMPIEDGDCNAGCSSARFLPKSMSANSYTVWAPFSSETDYFQPSTNPYMINLIVDVLDEALAQVKDGGATLVGNIVEYDFGRFGWFIDPEGNKVELWEPKEADYSGT